jgi:tetratricopeptide (TPR) repeat protein
VHTEYRVRLAEAARDWPRAQKLQEAIIAWRRRDSVGALAAEPVTLSDSQRNAIRNLAVAIEGFSRILLEQDISACLDSFAESMSLYQRIGDRNAEGVVAYNLGHAYKDIPGVRDPDQAEHWYKRSLELLGAHDALGRSQVTAQLGAVAYRRFLDSREAGEAVEQPTRHLAEAATAYEQALQLLPTEDVPTRTTIHHQLGVIYAEGGLTDDALHHYRQSIQYEEQQDNLYGAGQSRQAAAIALWRAKRNREALLYAQAALRDFETAGQGTVPVAERVRQLIALLEQKPQDEPEGSTDA